MSNQFVNRELGRICPFDYTRPDPRRTFSTPRLKEFGQVAEEYVMRRVAMVRPIETFIFICPDYPYDDSQNRFNYESGISMGGGLSPTARKYFDPRFNTFLEAIYRSVGSLPEIHLSPLVCDIESDLPNVVSRFADGKPEVFNARVLSSAKVTGEYFRRRYPYISVDPGTFRGKLRTGESDYLDNIRQYLSDKFAGKDSLPKNYQDYVEKVALSRVDMFRSLYGARNHDDNLQLAFRQMISYLSTAYVVSHMHPEGSIILNMATPNSYYVSKKPMFIRGLLDLPGKVNPPIFHFI